MKKSYMSAEDRKKAIDKLFEDPEELNRRAWSYTMTKEDNQVVGQAILNLLQLDKNEIREEESNLK